MLRGCQIAVTLVALLAVAVFTALVSLAVGARGIPLSDAWDALWGIATPRTPDAHSLIWDQRMQRTLLSLVAGLALGAAGALTHGYTRNPLADPGILGVNGGAATAVVLATLVLGVTNPLGMVAAALIGAAIAATLVFTVASGARTTPLTLVLAGTGLTAFFTAVTSAVVLSDSLAMDVWRFWTVGSTAGRDTDVVVAASVLIVVGLVAAVANSFSLNVLALGDEVAAGLGINIVRTRVIGLSLITILAGAATAACGPIMFLGLITPHIARVLVGSDYRRLVPVSALLGGIVLLICDIIGRRIALPGEVPAGLVLAFVGAPCFLLLVQSRRVARGLR